MDSITKIAITAQMRAGKDTVGNYFRDKHRYRTFAFADKPKRIAEDLFDYVEFADFGKDREKPRDLAEAIRLHVDENVWVRYVAKMIEAAEDSKSLQGVVIKDVRMPQEYEWVRANGYTVIKLETPEDTRKDRAKAAGDKERPEDYTHDSESYVNGFEADYTILNDGTLTELYEKVDEVLAQIKRAD